MSMGGEGRGWCWVSAKDGVVPPRPAITGPGGPSIVLVALSRCSALFHRSIGPGDG